MFPTAIQSGQVPRPNRRIPAALRGSPAPPEQNQSPLSDVFPQTRVLVVCGFEKLKVPTAFFSECAAAPTGAVAWCRLLDLTPADTFESECSLFAMYLSLASPDMNADGTLAADVLQWGSRVIGAYTSDCRPWFSSRSRVLWLQRKALASRSGRPSLAMASSHCRNNRPARHQGFTKSAAR
jgi:hypothetical protein